jgi:hypothetical protein
MKQSFISEQVTRATDYTKAKSGSSKLCVFTWRKAVCSHTYIKYSISSFTIQYVLIVKNYMFFILGLHNEIIYYCSVTTMFV